MKVNELRPFVCWEREVLALSFPFFSFDSSDGPELQWMSIKSAQNGVLHTVLISQYKTHQQ